MTDQCSSGQYTLTPLIKEICDKVQIRIFYFKLYILFESYLNCLGLLIKVSVTMFERITCYLKD